MSYYIVILWSYYIATICNIMLQYSDWLYSRKMATISLPYSCLFGQLFYSKTSIALHAPTHVTNSCWTASEARSIGVTVLSQYGYNIFFNMKQDCTNMALAILERRGYWIATKRYKIVVVLVKLVAYSTQQEEWLLLFDWVAFCDQEGVFYAANSQW